MTDLPEKLQGIAVDYLVTLIRARFENRITWKHPKKAREIAAAWNAMRERAGLPDLDLQDSDIRELTNYWRSLRWPIGTNGSGYWFAFTEAELEPAVAHMESRISKMSKALAEMKRANFAQLSIDIPDAGKNLEVLERSVRALISTSYHKTISNS